jgi:radical SAM protein with 4Fe4S-binding SPASM domain
MILRAKTQNLIQTRMLSEKQITNTQLNIKEMKQGKTVLKSKPQRFVFELTNTCNLNCVMCGRNSADFKPTRFDTNWFSVFDDIADSVEEVTLMGWGEPTMHPQFSHFLKWANKHGLRKYFCTNGMKLGEMMPSIFEEKVDVIAISLDGADEKTNSLIRRGADFEKIIANIKSVVAEKKRLQTPWPYMNFVTTLMKQNLDQLPKIVQLASEIGLEEVKGVYLTVFDEGMLDQSLFNETEWVRKVFDDTLKIAEQTGINVKLPHVRGEDEAGDALHKDCFTGWRDFFLGSDGYVRPCMSNSIKLFSIDKYKNFNEMWNSPEFIKVRETVNDKSKMPTSCQNCYQSSYANWNHSPAFLQIGKLFSPNWEE